MSKRKAIILAAGMGTRLKPLTETVHKCLTEVNGKKILHNALECLEQINVTDTTIVIGYLGQQVQENVGDSLGNMKISYVYNGIYDKTNTSYSLKLGIENLVDYQQLYVLEGDVFFEKQLLEHLAEEPEGNVTALEKYNANLDGTFAEVDDDFFVVDWVHKSKRPEGYRLKDKFKTVNLHRFSDDFVKQALYPEIISLEAVNNGRDPLENVMKHIVNREAKAVKGFDVAGIKWFEVDDEHDLKIAEEIFK